MAYLYSSFASLSATVSSAVSVTDSGVNVQTISRNVPNINADSSRTIIYTVVDNVIVSSTEQNTNIKATSFTSCKTMKVNLIVAKSSSSSDKNESFFEVWKLNELVKIIKLPVDHVHGKVCVDGWFGGISVSKLANSVVFGAEVLKRKTRSFFEVCHDDAPPSPGSSPSPVLVGSTNVDGEGQCETFGEKYTETSKLQLFICDLATSKVRPVKNVPGYEETFSQGGYSLGQAVFHPTQNKIAYCAWEVGDKRLGSIYCYQRPVKIYTSEIDEDSDTPFLCLTPDFRLSRSPAFSNSGHALAFLASAKGFDTHNGAMKLCVQEEGSESIDLSPEIIFTDKLLQKRCWSPDDSNIILTASDHSRQALFQFPAASFTRCLGDASFGELSASLNSHNLLELTDQGIVFTTSNPSTPTTLLAAAYSGALSSSPPLSFPRCATSGICDGNDQLTCEFTWKIIKIKNNVEAILLLPNSSSKSTPCPLIVTPHGGPHGMSTTHFVAAYAFLANSGYAILHVNYRGSTGYTMASLNELPGKCGVVDVCDVYDATKLVLSDSENNIDAEKVGICGGSHGGFLAAHMVGQHPELYKVAALRNPVTNIASMVSSTDIPDWCFVEALGIGKYDFDKFRGPNKEELGIMFDASPLRYAERVKAPLLFALGSVDLRVPVSQGLEYYYTMKPRVKTKMLRYDKDCHALDKPLTTADHWVNILYWFDDNL